MKQSLTASFAAITHVYRLGTRASWPHPQREQIGAQVVTMQPPVSLLHGRCGTDPQFSSLSGNAESATTTSPGRGDRGRCARAPARRA